MAATKAQSILSDNVTITAGTDAFPTIGNADGLESTEVDLSADYAAKLLIKVTNSGGALTAACAVRVEISSDGGTTWWSDALFLSTLGSGDVTEYTHALHASDMRVRTRSGGNTGNNVTLRVTAERITAV